MGNAQLWGMISDSRASLCLQRTRLHTHVYTHTHTDACKIYPFLFEMGQRHPELYCLHRSQISISSLWKKKRAFPRCSIRLKQEEIHWSLDCEYYKVIRFLCFIHFKRELLFTGSVWDNGGADAPWVFMRKSLKSQNERVWWIQTFLPSEP